MKIYIDESGIFSNPNNSKIAISCVGSLTIPDRLRIQVVKSFKKLLKRWGISKGSELKGKDVTEAQLVEIVDILERNHAMFTIVAIDTGYQDTADITAHKNSQCKALLNSINDNMHDSLKDDIISLHAKLTAMPLQLYIQSACTTVLVSNTIRNSTLYYSQSCPEALGNFSWHLDAKDKQITDSEDWWSKVIAPFLQTDSLRESLSEIEEGNYRAFSKYYNKTTKAPKHLEAHIQSDKDNFLSADIGMIMREDMNFSNSQHNYGIQLADILTTCLRRSLVGNFQRSGWECLSKVLFRNIRSKDGVHFITISKQPNKTKSYYGCINYLNENARSLRFKDTAS
ncbi:MAG: DUF3800 domain-containing protein [Pseudodesulfovibrio sp.]